MPPEQTTTTTATATATSSTHKARATSNTKKKPIPWDRDGVNDGDSSITILLNWLTSGNNYQRWCGDRNGLTKEHLCSEVIQLMEDQGITHRVKKGIRQKIGDLESSYITASDWKRNTGAGLVERDELNGVKTVDGYIRALCRCWDILDPIMGSRSHENPLHIRSSLDASHHPNETATQPNLVPSLASSEQDRRETEPQDDANPDESITSRTKKRTCPSTSSSRSPHKKKHKKKSIQELFIKSLVSKSVSETHRARAIASKAKVLFMAELRQQGYDKEQIALLTEKEFPPIQEYISDDENDDDDDSGD